MITVSLSLSDDNIDSHVLRTFSVYYVIKLIICDDHCESESESDGVDFTGT